MNGCNWMSTDLFARFATLWQGLATAANRCDNNISTMSTLSEYREPQGGRAPPRYEQIANALCQAIRSGQLKPGDRLPTLRRLASDLGVSLTTVTAAFKSLAENGWTRGEIGRGTFVVERGGHESASSFHRRASVLPVERRWPRVKSPWRRRALVSLMGRLRSTFSACDQLQLRGTRRVSTASEAHQTALAGRVRRRYQLRPAIQHRGPHRSIDRGFARTTERGWHSGQRQRTSSSARRPSNSWFWPRMSSAAWAGRRSRCRRGAAWVLHDLRHLGPRGRSHDRDGNG